jgi:hypothetical protein
MARPALSEEEKRMVQVNIRLTEEESKRVSQQAEGAGLTPANWIRQKIFTGKFPLIKASPIEAKLYRELHYIGNNLNQAIKLLHSGKLSPAYLTILTNLVRLKNDILKRLVG